jgi:hypothetical protein
MRTARGIAWLTSAALCLVGCGSVEPSARPRGDQPSASPRVGTCAPSSPAVKQARVVADADLDGDAKPDRVRLTAAGSACPDVVFAQVPGGYLSAQVPHGGPPVSSVTAITLEGRDGALLVVRQDHPRGGFQLRVYAAGPGGLAEVQAQGEPLVPFVATDVPDHPLSVDCRGDRLLVTEAVAHEPIGIVPAWDVRETAYTLDGSTVGDSSVKEIADNVLPQKLATAYPDLAKHTLFASCRG